MFVAELSASVQVQLVQPHGGSVLEEKIATGSGDVTWQRFEAGTSEAFLMSTHEL